MLNNVFNLWRSGEPQPMDGYNAELSVRALLERVEEECDVAKAPKKPKTEIEMFLEKDELLRGLHKELKAASEMMDRLRINIGIEHPAYDFAKYEYLGAKSSFESRLAEIEKSDPAMAKQIRIRHRELTRIYEEEQALYKQLLLMRVRAKRELINAQLHFAMFERWQLYAYMSDVGFMLKKTFTDYWARRASSHTKITGAHLELAALEMTESKIAA